MKPFIKLVLPEKAELFLFSSVALGLLLLQNAKRLWLLLGGNDATTLSENGSIDTQISNWITNAEARLDPRIADFLVWMLIGCIVFAILEYVITQVRSTDEEVELLHNTRSERSKTQEFRTYMARLALRIAGAIGMLFWFIVFVRAVNPALTKLFFVNAATLTDPIAWLWIALSIGAMAVSLYVFAVFARVIALRPRVFGAGEEV